MPFDNLPELDKINLALRAARECIERGWVQGILYDAMHENHCVVGALRVACGTPARVNPLQAEDPFLIQSLERFSASLPSYYRRKYGKLGCLGVVARWNDSHTRTKEQVLAQFDKLIQPVNVR
jgi:hypothetical protein